MEAPVAPGWKVVFQFISLRLTQMSLKIFVRWSSGVVTNNRLPSSISVLVEFRSLFPTLFRANELTRFVKYLARHWPRGVLVHAPRNLHLATLDIAEEELINIRLWYFSANIQVYLGIILQEREGEKERERKRERQRGEIGSKLAIRGLLPS